MDSLRLVLIANPLLLLFLVCAIGYPLGQFRVAGASLGVGAVLFVGLAIGSLDPALKLPEIVYLLGLVLFVYTVGLSSGASFFASMRGRGLRLNALVLCALLIAAAVVVVLHRATGMSGGMAAGLFAGSLTNTPALAAELDYLRHVRGPATPALADPVVGYSLTYPLGVLGMMLAMIITRRVLKVPQRGDRERARRTLEEAVVLVTHPAVAGRAIGELAHAEGWLASFGRIRRGPELLVAAPDERFQLGDLFTVVGPAGELQRIAATVGERRDERIDLDRRVLDYRRIFVSNPEVAGRTLRELNLPARFTAVVTRVRRGDVEFVPQDDTVIELGDRLRVITHRRNMAAVTKFLGDSYRALSEIDVLTFSAGCALGLLVGLVPLPIPGGVSVRLGFAGGPLIVALVLGNFGRTGPVLWTLPYSANLTLRQIGLILFLAGVGTRAGYDFGNYVVSGGGLLILGAGAIVTAIAALVTMWAGAALLKVPYPTLAGVLAGLQTQPAVLAFSVEQTQEDTPTIGYATVYPVAMIAKVLLGQLLVALIR